MHLLGLQFYLPSQFEPKEVLVKKRLTAAHEEHWQRLGEKIGLTTEEDGGGVDPRKCRKAGNEGIVPLLVPDRRHRNSNTVAELEISKSGHWSLNLGAKAEIYDKIHIFMGGAITPGRRTFQGVAPRGAE
ncbi:hypothetical protein C8R45DRAFT_934912 [Mycena sanguinolenta]|nr:hypothetical protein C8R45DRAFT_934912 [Mycena sanguinolenta]